MSTTSRYYYVDAQNQAAGPVTLADLQNLQSNGTIPNTTLVALEGSQDWVPFSTLPQPTQAVPLPQPAAQPIPQPTPAPAPASAPATAPTPASEGQPAWANQLLEKLDQLISTSEKIILAVEKSGIARQPLTLVPATAALHAEKLSLNPSTKTGIAQHSPVPHPGTAPSAIPRPTPLPPGISTTLPTLARPSSSTILTPMAVPANAVKSPLSLPSLGAAPVPTPAPAPAKPGNLFSKFLKK